MPKASTWNGKRHVHPPVTYQQKQRCFYCDKQTSGKVSGDSDAESTTWVFKCNTCGVRQPVVFK
jgi:hypothetical protein